MCTHINLTPVAAFLSAYNHHPIPYHLKSDLYALRYFHFTSNLGIQFSSASNTETYTQILHVFPHYQEEYIGVSDPRTSSQCRTMRIRVILVYYLGTVTESGLNLWKLPSSNCTTHKPGVPPRKGSSDIRLYDYMQINYSWYSRNF